LQELQDYDQPTDAEKQSSWAFYLSLSLLGPFFFLSLIFSLLSPLPILYLHQGITNRTIARRWAYSAAIIGIILCGIIKGILIAIGFGIFGALPALVIAETLERKKSPQSAIISAWGGILASLIISGIVYSQWKQIELVPYLKTTLTQSVQEMSKKVIENEKKFASGLSEEDLKKISETPEVLVEEIPGIAMSVILLLCTFPTLLLLRWNPKGMGRRLGISRDALRKWKAPEWLVWPALLCGGFLGFEYEPYSSVANNALKPILVIYFFQGMSILAYFLDSLRLRGPIRVILYSFGVLFLTPMIMSFGFFDLWFNFRDRSKNRKEGGEKNL